MPLTTTVHQSWSTVDQSAWDALVGRASPFLEHGWLAGLEHSGSASPATGWHPRPITVERDGVLIGGAPAWLLDHDEGQFVYQAHWARAAEQAGLALHPKLVLGVPFTPVTGGRLLVGSEPDAEAVRTALFGALTRLGSGAEGVHALFPLESELPHWEQRGFFRRKQYQFHWHNADYHHFDDFLARFRSARRKEIRRERRAVQHLDFSVVPAPDPALLDQLWEAYDATVERYGATDRFLNRAFFESLSGRFRDRLVAIVARDGGRFIGGALNVVKGDRLYGRYWGRLVDERFLHFEICYHRGVEHCIEAGLQAFEPGHGGDHKFRRGFEPVETWSAHRFRHRGVHASFRKSAQRETDWFDERLAELRERSPLKPLAGPEASS